MRQLFVKLKQVIVARGYVILRVHGIRQLSVVIGRFLGDLIRPGVRIVFTVRIKEVAGIFDLSFLQEHQLV